MRRFALAVVFLCLAVVAGSSYAVWISTRPLPVVAAPVTYPYPVKTIPVTKTYVIVTQTAPGQPTEKVYLPATRIERQDGCILFYVGKDIDTIYCSPSLEKIVVYEDTE